MSNSALHVIATMTAHPDKVEEVKAILLGLIAPTRQEAGCIAYQLLHNRADPSDFILDEEWTSNEALDQHLESPHIAAALPRLEPLVANISIQRYDLIA